MGKPEYLITIPKRGVQIIAPPETRKNMEYARGKMRMPLEARRLMPPVSWTHEERARLKIIVQDPTLKKRYPDPEIGNQFMHEVSYERREYLYGLSSRLSSSIVESWYKFTVGNPIAVVLFGSITRGLVKSVQNGDPSNIDLAVIGDITEKERSLLFDAIREDRLQLQKEILETCVQDFSNRHDVGNAGVHIQTPQKLRNGNFYAAKQYIASCAIPMFDPFDIWGAIEREVLKGI